MYDPHGLRRNDRRYFTRKGQIIQAKNIDPPFKIERNKIEAYKKFILKNSLVDINDILPIYIDSIKITQNGETAEIPISVFNYTSTSYTDTFDSGHKLCFSVADRNDDYNFNIFYTTSNQAVFPPNTWFHSVYITDSSNLLVNFASQDVSMFNVEIVPNDNYIKIADVELEKNVFNIPLPAPSD